mgnify:FL=1
MSTLPGSEPVSWFEPRSYIDRSIGRSIKRACVRTRARSFAARFTHHTKNDSLVSLLTSGIEPCNLLNASLLARRTNKCWPRR